MEKRKGNKKKKALCVTMDANRAIQYLESLIGQTLRVHATDTRIFVGNFKCTDAVGEPRLPVSLSDLHGSSGWRENKE